MPSSGQEGEPRNGSHGASVGISQLKTVLNSFPDPVICIDSQGTVRWLNAAVSPLLGWTDDQLVGQNIKILLPEPYRSQFDGFLQQYRETGESRLLGQPREFEMVRQDGSVFPSEVCVWRVDADEGEEPLFLGKIRDITRRHQAKAELLQSETRLQMMLASTLDPMITITGDGLIQTVSDSVERVFGWTAEELLGQNINRLMPEPYHSEHDQYLANYHRTGQTNIMGEAREFEAVRKDGSKFPCEITVWRVNLPAHDEPLFMGIVRDITERKQAEMALRESREWLSTTLTSIGDGVIATDTDARITFMNPIAQKLTGWQDDSGIGQPLDGVFRIVNEQTQLPVENPVARVLEEGVIVGLANHTALISREGTVYSIADSGSPIRNLQGEITGTVLVFRDVSDLKDAEHESRKHQEELAHVYRLNTLGEMATGLAHELNQPMAGIANYATAGLRILGSSSLTAETEKVADLLQRIESQAQRAGNIIRRLRKMVSKREPQRNHFQVNDAVEEVVELIISDMRTEGIVLSLELANGLPSVLGDLIQVEQVLLNLLRNGIESILDYSESEQGLTIRTYLVESEMVGVSIIDTGPKTTQEKLKPLFDPFYSTKAEGMGMGLSISRSIIESHNGTIWADANNDNGITVSFTLPTNGGQP